MKGLWRRYKITNPGFEDAVAGVCKRGDADLARVEPQVAEIGRHVRTEGDTALRALTKKFEQRDLDSIMIDPEFVRTEAEKVDAQTHAHLAEAAARIRRYHERQRDAGFEYTEEGVDLCMRVRPVRAAGVYAPGGKARYPSSVLMTAIPASVAGVPRIVLATPRPTPDLFAAALLAGVHEVVDLGGAQAIFALAYGTESVAPVDVITGPGNIYVACAKRLVFGTVGIDQIAGPSEILVVADETASPRVVAADLLSQAEHDEAAYPLLVAWDDSFVDAVEHALVEQLTSLPRKDIATRALADNGAAFVVSSRAEAIALADRIAIEHLALHIDSAEEAAEEIRAGAIFLGGMTPEAAGDYAAGPSHVLPTGGAARHSSALGVHDYIVRTSMIRYSRVALGKQAQMLTRLARLEGLEAHARAIEFRLEDE